MNPDEILKLVLVPLAVTVVGGLVLAAILAIFIKPVRERFWKPIGRTVRNLLGLRLITKRRLAVLDAERARLRGEVADAIRQGDRRAARAELNGVDRGRSEAFAEVETERARPRIEPNWVVVRAPLGANFVLRNSQPEARAADVSISAPVEEFTFEARTQWPGEFGAAQQFQGVPTGAGRRRGVHCLIRWRDELGDWNEGEAFIDREPRVGTML